jgi:hypothetical protein
MRTSSLTYRVAKIKIAHQPSIPYQPPTLSLSLLHFEMKHIRRRTATVGNKVVVGDDDDE